MKSLRSGYTGVVVGSSGGIGSAVLDALCADGNSDRVIGVDRTTYPNFDLADENSIASIAKSIEAQLSSLDLIFIATGALTVNSVDPEKSLKTLDPVSMARSYAVNTIGPAMLIKHLTPMLSSGSKTVVATLSARVGSIGDNHLGGWHSYRASKAALNQIVRTASIELNRTKPQSLCIALHPGTVATKLSLPFSKNKTTLSPSQSANLLLNVLDELTSQQTGRFYAYDGSAIEW